MKKLSTLGESIYKIMCAKAPYSQVLSSCKADRTKESYAGDYSQLDTFLNGGNPWAMNMEQMFAFIIAMKERRLAHRTISRRMAAYKRLFKYGMRHKFVTSDPTLAFEDIDVEPAQRNPKALSKEQREHLKASLKWDTSLNRRISLMVMIGLYTGLRLNEIRLLKWDDINFQKQTLKTIGKRSKEATLPIPDPLFELLKEYKVMGYVIGEVSHAEVGWWNRTIVKRWCGWGKEVTYSCHVLRHSFITELAENKVSPEIIKDLARHASFDMTTKYIKIQDDSKKSELDRVFNKK